MDNKLMALAIIPGLLILIYVYGKDKVEKEPIGLIIKLVLLGVISCIAAGFAEQALSTVYPQYPPGTLEYALITSFGLAALCEEILICDGDMGSDETSKYTSLMTAIQDLLVEKLDSWEGRPRISALALSPSIAPMPALDNPEECHKMEGD